MKEAQLHSSVAKRGRERLLRLVQRPGRREDTCVFPRIGIADHDLLEIAARDQLALVQRIVEQRAHHRGSALEIGESLEERHDVEPRHGRIGGEVHEPGLAREQQNAH